MTIKNIIDRDVWNMYLSDDSIGKLNLFDIFDNDKKYANVYYLRSGNREGFFRKESNKERAIKLCFYEYYQGNQELRYNELIHRLIRICQQNVKIEGNFSYYFKPLYEAVAQELVETIESIYKTGEVTEDIINTQLNRKIDREYGRLSDDGWQEVGKIVKKDFGYII